MIFSFLQDLPQDVSDVSVGSRIENKMEIMESEHVEPDQGSSSLLNSDTILPPELNIVVRHDTSSRHQHPETEELNEPGGSVTIDSGKIFN